MDGWMSCLPAGTSHESYMATYLLSGSLGWRIPLLNNLVSCWQPALSLTYLASLPSRSSSRSLTSPTSAFGPYALCCIPYGKGRTTSMNSYSHGNLGGTPVCQDADVPYPAR